MPGIFYPRHRLHVAAVLEDFSGDRGSPLDRAVEWDVVPRAATLERNDVHTADRLTVELDFRSCPFDPRSVRAASVAYYAGTVDGEGGELPVAEKCLRFLGTVDTPEIALSEHAGATTFECRDYTAIFLGVRARPAMAVPLDRPMDAVLGDLFGFLPGEFSSRIGLAIQGPDGAPMAWPTVHGGGRRSAKLHVEPRDTLWGLIRHVVEDAGLVCFVHLDRLIVSTPRTLGADGNLLDTAQRVQVSFGKNLADFRLKRTFQTQTRPVVVAQYDPRTATTTRSEWPTDDALARSRGGRSGTPPGAGRGRRPAQPPVVITRRTGAPATAQPSDTAEEFAVTGSRSREELTLLAERIHRQRTLYEIEGAFTTCDPVLPSVNDAGDDAGDFDVWSIHTATTVVATIAPHAHAIGLADTADGFGSGAAAKALLVSLGYPAELASALAESWRALGRLRLPFIVRKATLSMGEEQGFKAAVDFMAMLDPTITRDLRAEVASPARAAPRRPEGVTDRRAQPRRPR